MSGAWLPTLPARPRRSVRSPPRGQRAPRAPGTRPPASSWPPRRAPRGLPSTAAGPGPPRPPRAARARARPRAPTLAAGARPAPAPVRPLVRWREQEPAVRRQAGDQSHVVQGAYRTIFSIEQGSAVGRSLHRIRHGCRLHPPFDQAQDRPVPSRGPLVPPPRSTGHDGRRRPSSTKVVQKPWAQCTPPRHGAQGLGAGQSGD